MSASLREDVRDEACEIAETILGARLDGFIPSEPPRPQDMLDGIDAWAERLAWLVLQEIAPAESGDRPVRLPGAASGAAGREQALLAELSALAAEHFHGGEDELRDQLQQLIADWTSE